MPNNNNVVDTLQIDVVLNSDDYKKRVGELEDLNKHLLGSLNELDKDYSKLQESHKKTETTLNNVVKGFGRFFGALAVATGVEKLVNDVALANDQLGFLEKQLNLNSDTIRNWQGAISAGGGSAQGATNAFKTLTGSINNFVMKGEAGLTPYLNALGVNMFDAQGHIKKTDDLMLDLADSFSKMDSSQAYSIGKDMGFDEGTIGSLIQGRDALKESLAYQNALYKSSQQDIKNSRELQRNRSLLNSQWDSFKTMLGNQFIPIMIKVSEVVLRLFETMQKHQDTVKVVFGGLAVLLSASIIPLFTRALTPLLAFIAPFAPFVGVIASLAVGFLALYDDYKTWAEGGKSLFDWGALKTFLDENTFSVENLGKAFSEIGKDIKEQFIPTLQGYKEILSDLISGDYKKAGEKTKQMVSQFSDNVFGVLGKATGEKPEDLQGFIGESMYRLTHYGKTYDEYNNVPSQVNAPTSKPSNKKQEFITKYMPVAQKVSQKIGVPPDVLLGQWAKETGWGNSITPGTGFNLGNIKAGSSWKGKTVRAYDGREGSNDPYRVYDNADQFADDYSDFLMKRKGYKNALGQQTAEGFFSGLQQGGYATDKDYVKSGVATTNSVRAELARMNASKAMRQSSPVNSLADSISRNSGNTTTNNVTISMPNLNVNTSSSTLSGVTADAMKQNSGQLTGLIGVMK